jgi:hypothetical protein
MYVEYCFFYSWLTTSVSDGAEESDPRSPTGLKSFLKNKEMRQEGSITTGAVAMPTCKITVHLWFTVYYVICAMFVRPTE